MIMDSKFGGKSYSSAWFKGLKILDLLLCGLMLFSMCSELWSCDDFLLWLVLANCCQMSLLIPSSLCLASNFPTADQCNITLQNSWFFCGGVLISDEKHLSVLMPRVIWFKFPRPISDKFRYVCVCIERLGSGFIQFFLILFMKYLISETYQQKPVFLLRKQSSGELTFSLSLPPLSSSCPGAEISCICLYVSLKRHTRKQ